MGKYCAWFYIEKCMHNPRKMCVWCRNIVIKELPEKYNEAEEEITCISKCPLWNIVKAIRDLASHKMV